MRIAAVLAFPLLVQATTTAAQEAFAGRMAAFPTFAIVEALVAREPGYLVAREIEGDELGDVLGRAPVRMGANANVEIRWYDIVSDNIALVLYAGAPVTPENIVEWVEVEVQEADGYYFPWIDDE